MPNSEAKKAANRAYAKRRYARLHDRETTETETEDSTEKPSETPRETPRIGRESEGNAPPNAWIRYKRGEQPPLPIRRPVTEPPRRAEPKRPAKREEPKHESVLAYARRLAGGGE